MLRGFHRFPLGFVGFGGLETMFPRVLGGFGGSEVRFSSSFRWFSSVFIEFCGVAGGEVFLEF